jgi:hypothetical protein
MLQEHHVQGMLRIFLHLIFFIKTKGRCMATNVYVCGLNFTQLIKRKKNMKKFMKWACIASLLMGVLASCTEDPANSAYMQVTPNTAGCLTLFDAYITDQCNQFNTLHNQKTTQEAAIQEFDQFVVSLANNINQTAYDVFGNTSVSLVLNYNNATIKETKLELQPTYPNAPVLSVEVTIQDELGDHALFRNDYGKKLTDMGLLADGENKYAFYQEYATYDEAKAQFDTMNQEGLLDIPTAIPYFHSLTGYQYRGKISINYFVVDGREAPEETGEIKGKDEIIFSYKSVDFPTYKTSNGYVIVNVTE